MYCMLWSLVLLISTFSLFCLPQFCKSNEVNWIHIAGNLNHIASVGFTILTKTSVLDTDLGEENQKWWKKPQEEPQSGSPSPKYQ